MNDITVIVNEFYNPTTLEIDHKKLSELINKIKNTKQKVIIMRKLNINNRLVPLEWIRQKQYEINYKKKKQAERMKELIAEGGLNTDFLEDDIPMPTGKEYNEMFMRHKKDVIKHIRDTFTLLNMEIKYG